MAVSVGATFLRAVAFTGRRFGCSEDKPMN
jgi:hypothetical protein